MDVDVQIYGHTVNIDLTKNSDMGERKDNSNILAHRTW